jgi:deoxyribodipyrimidine photo-lyase
MAAGEDKPLRQKGGRSHAEALLTRFFTPAKVKRYPFSISSPNSAWEGCSRVSTYLAYGILSDREVFQAVDRAVTDANAQYSKSEFERFQDNARFYLDRLSWRRQYMQTFESNPRLEFECMLAQFNGIRESEYCESEYCESDFEAWKDGRTGYPYIDAAMRFLNKSGWLNMRLRATVVSFATMNLWIPTTRVAEHLAQEFLDYEPGIQPCYSSAHCGNHHL